MTVLGFGNIETLSYENILYVKNYFHVVANIVMTKLTFLSD